MPLVINSLGADTHTHTHTSKYTHTHTYSHILTICIGSILRNQSLARFNKYAYANFEIVKVLLIR